MGGGGGGVKGRKCESEMCVQGEMGAPLPSPPLPSPPLPSLPPSLYNMVAESFCMCGGGGGGGGG